MEKLFDCTKGEIEFGERFKWRGLISIVEVDVMEAKFNVSSALKEIFGWFFDVGRR
jgi:hypothetical protein